MLRRCVAPLPPPLLGMGQIQAATSKLRTVINNVTGLGSGVSQPHLRGGVVSTTSNSMEDAQ